MNMALMRDEYSNESIMEMTPSESTQSENDRVFPQSANPKSHPLDSKEKNQSFEDIELNCDLDDCENCAHLHTNQIILCFDPEGNLRSASEKALSVLKMNREEFIGKNILSFANVFGIRKNNWLDEIRREFHTQNLAEITCDNQKFWFLWDFSVQLNKDASIDMIIGRGREISDFTQSENSIVQDRNHDYLTGLLNRQGLQDELTIMEDYVEKAAAFFIDCWTFSKIIDYYGHHISDEIVLLLAKDLLRESNSEWLISRYSDTQFVIVCINQEAEEAKIQSLIDRLEKQLISIYSTRDYTFQIDKRIGYAVFPDDTPTLSKLISCSSLAMKESIKLDQISVKRYQKHMSLVLEQNVLFAQKLRNALETNQIEIYFQKIINTEDSSVYSLEELARWTDSELGVISPKTLFSIAKESNMIDRLERYLVEKALIAITKVNEKRPYHHTKLALNITPSSLLDIHFLSFLDEMVQQYGLKPSDICVEISESTFINNVDYCIRRINEFKQHGYEIAIDDFGKEYSSLAILESVSFDIIKIDALFVDKIHLPKNQEIIKMISRIAKITNAKMISEGVETKEQRDLLHQLGSTFQQGYFFNRPERISAFLEN